MFLTLKSETENLVEAMRKYYQYLVDKNSIMAQHHKSMESSQTLENASIKILPANKSLSDSLSDYVELNEKLQSMNMYEPLFINDYMPADQYLKRKWLNKYCITLSSMHVLLCIWK